MSLAEAGQPRQQPADGEGTDRADRQNLAKPPALELIEQAADAVERLLQRRQQRPTLVGQGKAARQAVEQAGAQPLLQQLDLMADGGLGHAQLDGGAGETEMPRRRLEGAQGVQGQIGPDHGFPGQCLMPGVS